MEIANSAAWRSYIKRKANELNLAPQQVQQMFFLEYFADKVSRSRYKEFFKEVLLFLR